MGRRGRRLRGRRRPARRGEEATIRERAEAAGAVEIEIIDAREEFARDFLAPALRANALYEGKYPLVSALSRPVIVEHLVASARRHGADAVGHGCTGKGNDQVRFEVSSRMLAPDLEVMAPVRVWGLTRADCIELAAKWDIPISASKEKLYSIDENMWGRAIECGVLENPWATAPEEPFTLTRHPKDAPSDDRDVVVSFDPACRSRSTARRCVSSRSSKSSERSSAATAGVVSTWSRTAGSGSRAARCTSARPRSR